jgi:hypothetical protein
VVPRRSEGHVSFNGPSSAVLLPCIDRPCAGDTVGRVTFHPFTSISPRRRTGNDRTSTEASLLDYLEVQPHTIREEPFPAADDHGADIHLELVDKTRPYR